MRNLLRKLSLSVAALGLLLSLSASAMNTDKGDKKDKGMKEATLYKRLGGKTAITAVIEEFVNNCAGDARINKFFADTAKDPKRLAKFKKHLVNQVCEASGGPCKYKGKDMKAAHKGMGIKDEHFNALVEDLVKALDKFKVPEKEKNELLGLLGPMKADMIE